jgi:tetratricopeptide (TPR) repeat protein
MQKFDTDCEICTRPATTTRSLGRDALALCDRCNEQMEVRDAFDSQLLTLAELERSDPEKALNILNELRCTHGKRDHDGWLDRSVRAHRAHIFTRNDRYDEALRELRELREFLILGSRDYAENQDAIAFALNRSGSPREAITELEKGLTELEKGPPDDSGVRARITLDLLISYARIANDQDWTVSSHFNKPFADAVATKGIEVPPDVISSSLRDAILFAAAREREAGRRYDSLVRELKGKSPEVRANMVNVYISAEEVGSYRELARKALLKVPE